MNATPVVLPALSAGEEKRVHVDVKFSSQLTKGADPDRFEVHGDHLDRSQSRDYDVITRWPDQG